MQFALKKVVSILLVILAIFRCSQNADSLTSNGKNVIDKVLNIEDSETFERVDLSPYCDYIEDPEGILKFEDIKKDSTVWQKVPKHKVNFGFNSSYFWVRFSIHNLSKKPFKPIFEISFSRQDYIEIYFPNNQGNFNKYTTGDTFPYSQREIKNLGFAFNLNQSPQTQQIYYIRTRSVYNGSILNPNLFSPNSFQEWSSSRSLVNGLIYGFSGIMILYNLFLFITIREKVYLYVSAATLSFCVFLLGFHGTSYQYFYPNNPWLQNHDIFIFPIFILVFILLYTNEYLDLKINAPRILKINQWVIALLTVLPFILLYSVQYNSILTFKFLGFVGISIILFAIAIGIYLCTQKYRPAFFYVASFASFFIGTITYLFTITFILIPNVFIYWSFQVGYCAMLILLSLGLADKINYLKNILKEANNSLEQKVENRTIELSAALKSIRSDLNTAKKIQTNTLPKKTNLDEAISVDVKYLPMNEVGGDFYDITKLQNGTIRIFLADATGHGVQAALMTMAIHSEYQNIRNYPLSPGEILSILNRQYHYRYVYLNAYFTCILVDIDIENNKIFYASGGHPDQYLFHSNSVSILNSTGKLMGVMKDMEYKTTENDFFPGDRVFLFTDGIFEEFNSEREEFGEERFLELSKANFNLPNKEYLDKILNTIYAYLAGEIQQDDITLLFIERNKT